MSSSLSAAPVIEITSVSKWYGGFQALNNVSLNVAKGERVVIARALCMAAGNHAV